MSQRVYVDTNVFMDFLLDRDTRAFDFFMRAVSCEFNIIISDVILFELSRQGVSFDLLGSMLKHKLILEKVSDLDRLAALSMPTHRADALHAAVAQRVGADIFLSNDKGFFFLSIHERLDEI